MHLTVDEMKAIASDFKAIYDKADDKNAWFEKIKTVASKYGFATDMKSYKENPENFKGSISDISNVLRIFMTGRTQSPDLHAIMQIMGVDRLG